MRDGRQAIHVDVPAWLAVEDGGLAAQQALCQWVTQHGLDPLWVKGVSDVVRDEKARTITVEWVLDNRATGRGLVLYDYEDNDRGHIATRYRTVQLEAPPLPFPAAVMDFAEVIHA